MNTKKQRLAIARFCGWKYEFIHGNGVDDYVYVDPAGKCYTDFPAHLPNYIEDLNAMHKAEEGCLTTEKLWTDYGYMLTSILNIQSGFAGSFYLGAKVAHATASQRAEAFLRTLGLWEE